MLNRKDNFVHEDFGDTHLATFRFFDDVEDGENSPHDISDWALKVCWWDGERLQEVAGAITGRDDTQGMVEVAIPADHQTAFEKQTEYRLIATENGNEVSTKPRWVVLRS